MMVCHSLSNIFSISFVIFFDVGFVREVYVFWIFPSLLINILSKRIKKYNGQVIYNDKKLNSISKSSFNSESGTKFLPSAIFSNHSK